jgi:cytidylate kinase
MAVRGDATNYQDVLAAQRLRDQRDAERDIAPMVSAADAVLVDSTRLTLDEVVSFMEQHVRRCLAETSASGTAPLSGQAAPR